MKTTLLSKHIFILTLLWSCLANAGNYLYSELQMKNFDEMEAQVKKRVLAAQKVADDDVEAARLKLKDALQLIFSRPNRDNMVSQLFPTPRSPLKNLDAFESTIQEIVEESIASAKKNPAPTAERATSIVILENIMSELRPDSTANPKVKIIFEKIRDAKIEVPGAVKNELRMRAMIKTAVSPSELAKQIIGPAKR